MSVAARARPASGGGRGAEDLDRRRAYERELLFAETLELMAAMLESGEITQRELARRLGTDEGYVSRILNGGRPNLTLKTIADIGWALGFRFSLTPVPLADREATPAAGDPPPARWIAGERRRLANTTQATGPAARPG
jgi:transcriptional regulator with XRE-family HTH domain